MTKIIKNKIGNGVNISRIIAVAYLLWAAHPSHCAPFGLPVNTAKIGYGVGYAVVSVDDPDGNSKDEGAVQPLNLVYTDWLFSNSKLFSDIKQWTEVFYFETSLDAVDNNIGQDVQSFGIRFSLQKSFRFTDSFSPWFGAGVDISRTRYTVRHTRDAEGFLLQSFEDRDDTGIAFLFNIINEWTLQSDWSLAAKLEQSIPLSADISQFTAALVLLYRY
ncbi:MAG TPA: hypothetical protein VIM41_08495 [Gammaproteobacteria bacterium]